MIKKFLILIIILFQSNPSFSDEFNWTKVAEEKSGESEFYLDLSSQRRIDNYNYQWLLINYLKNSDEGKKSGIAYTTIDCKNSRIQEIIFAEFSEKSARGNTETHELLTDESLEWLEAEPNTVAELIVNSGCKKNLSSIKSPEPRKKSEKKKKKKSKYKEF